MSWQPTKEALPVETNKRQNFLKRNLFENDKIRGIRTFQRILSVIEYLIINIFENNF